VDGSLTHSTRFVLVDGKRQIRGYYSFDDDGIVDKLAADVKALHNELTGGRT
jgi:cytochrome oxidase Cu insertion factor (SCO1/SenC/PrrC family)